MTLVSAHIALFVVVRFSVAFALAVVFAFALALVVVFALAFAPALAVVLAAAFADPFSVAFALALAFAFTFCSCLCNPLPLCFSEVVDDPRLVRVQAGMDNRPQLVVVTLKLLRVHQQMVLQFLWGLTRERFS